MSVYPDGRTLVPDLSGALQMALGYRQEQRQQAQQQEAAQLGGQLTGGLNDALQNPEAQKTLQRMYQLDPRMAQFTLGLMEARDTSAMQQAAQASEEIGRFYQGVLTLKPEERRDALLAKAAEMKDAGQPFEQILEMAGADPTQQEIGLRRKLVLNGQFQALAGPSLKEQLELQNKQLEFFKTLQGMEIDREKNARDSEAAARAAQKDAEARAKGAEQEASRTQSMQAKAEFIGDQLNLAVGQMQNAWSGRAGKVANFLSPAGDTASLRNTLETLTSNIGFGELMRMKAESPTGGALGSVSERELSLLNATLGNLDAFQNPADLYRVLQQVHSVYDRISRSSGGNGLPPLPPVNGRAGSGAGPAQSAPTAPGSIAPPAGTSSGDLVDWEAM